MGLRHLCAFPFWEIRGIIGSLDRGRLFLHLTCAMPGRLPAKSMFHDDRMRQSRVFGDHSCLATIAERVGDIVDALPLAYEIQERNSKMRDTYRQVMA